MISYLQRQDCCCCDASYAPASGCFQLRELHVAYLNFEAFMELILRLRTTVYRLKPRTSPIAHPLFQSHEILIAHLLCSKNDMKAMIKRRCGIYTVYDRIFGDFPAQNTVYTPCIYGSGQLLTFTMGGIQMQCVAQPTLWPYTAGCGE